MRHDDSELSFWRLLTDRLAPNNWRPASIVDAEDDDDEPVLLAGIVCC